MNELNRIRHLAGLLTEGVVSIPGVGKKEEPNEVDHMFDKDDEQWANDKAQEHNQDVGSEFDPKLGETAPEGWEGTVKAMKKHPEIDNPWALANYMKNKGYKSHAEESGPGMEECSMIEEGAFKEVIQQKIQRAQELKDSMVDPEEASEIIAAELKQEGFSGQDVLNILDAVAEELEVEDEEDYDDNDCPTCQGTGIGQHGDPDTSRCYNCGGSGVLRGERDYDDFDEPYDDEDDWIGPLEEQTAEQAAEDGGEVEGDDGDLEEAYDLNNGYEDVKYSKGNDYFPTGADSPVTSHTGPSGARQGDNPEQKRMEVAEAHKELVYNYRKFLKESASK